LIKFDYEDFVDHPREKYYVLYNDINTNLYEHN